MNKRKRKRARTNRRTRGGEREQEQGNKQEEQEEGEDEDEFADCYARALKEDQERASSSRVREQIAEIYAQHGVPLDVDMVMREHEQYYGQDKESELLQKVQQKINKDLHGWINIVEMHREM